LIQGAKDTATQVSNAITTGGKDVAQAIIIGGKAIGTALAGGSVAGATAYAIKNAKIPPVAKAGLIVGSAAAGSIIQNISTSGQAIFPSTSNTNSQPTTPTETPFNEFSKSSIGDFFGDFFFYLRDCFDLNLLFGVDPTNHAINLIFSLLSLSILNLFFVYILSIYLVYIYMYYNNNFEFK
jgi:hypothetical protein